MFVLLLIHYLLLYLIFLLLVLYILYYFLYMDLLFFTISGFVTLVDVIPAPIWLAYNFGYCLLPVYVFGVPYVTSFYMHFLLWILHLLSASPYLLSLYFLLLFLWLYYYIIFRIYHLLNILRYYILMLLENILYYLLALHLLCLLFLYSRLYLLSSILMLYYFALLFGRYFFRFWAAVNEYPPLTTSYVYATSSPMLYLLKSAGVPPLFPPLFPLPPSFSFYICFHFVC